MDLVGKILSKTEVSFQAKYSCLSDIRKATLEVCQSIDFEIETCYRIELAVDEACTNIIEHAYGGETDQQIDFLFINTEKALIIQLHDQGSSFDPSSIPTPPVNADLSERTKGGLGLFLIRNNVDEIFIQNKPLPIITNNLAPDGNFLYLIKYKHEGSK